MTKTKDFTFVLCSVLCVCRFVVLDAIARGEIILHSELNAAMFDDNNGNDEEGNVDKRSLLSTALMSCLMDGHAGIRTLACRAALAWLPSQFDEQQQQSDAGNNHLMLMIRTWLDEFVACAECPWEELLHTLLAIDPERLRLEADFVVGWLERLLALSTAKNSIYKKDKIVPLVIEIIEHLGLEADVMDSWFQPNNQINSKAEEDEQDSSNDQARANNVDKDKVLSSVQGPLALILAYGLLHHWDNANKEQDGQPESSFASLTQGIFGLEDELSQCLASLAIATRTSSSPSLPKDHTKKEAKHGISVNYSEHGIELKRTRVLLKMLSSEDPLILSQYYPSQLDKRLNLRQTALKQNDSPYVHVDWKLVKHGKWGVRLQFWYRGCHALQAAVPTKYSISLRHSHGDNNNYNINNTPNLDEKDGLFNVCLAKITLAKKNRCNLMQDLREDSVYDELVVRIRAVDADGEPLGQFDLSPLQQLSQ